MIKQNLLECNKIERSKDEVTARAEIIIFDSFMKAMSIEETINKHMPVSGSNRGLKAWQYIRRGLTEEDLGFFLHQKNLKC